MPRATALSPQELELLASLRKDGYTYTFHLSHDCIVCDETNECYAADTFYVDEMHAFGRDKEQRRIVYALEFSDGDKGVILGLSKEINEVDDPVLYAKLLII